MKKKILAVLLSAAMVMSSLTVGMAATESSLTVDGFMAAKTSKESVSGNFHSTYKFHNAGSGAVDVNYKNFILYITDSNGGVLTARADRCSWSDDYATEVGAWGANCAYYDLQGIDWTTFGTDMNDAEVTLDVYRCGNWISYKVLYECSSGKTYEYICELPELVGLEENLSLQLSGEAVTLTNITYTENEAPAEGSIKTAVFGYAKTEKVTLSGDFDVTYKFNNATYGSQNYHNAFISVVDEAGNDIAIRTDRCAFQGDEGGDYYSILGAWGANVQYVDSIAVDWTNFMTTMADADVTFNLTRTGEVLSWTVDAVNGEKTHSFTGTTPALTGLSDDLTIYLSGELTVLSDIEFGYNDVKTVGGAYRENDDDTVDLAFVTQVDIADFADATEIGVVIKNAAGVENVCATPCVSSNTDAGADSSHYVFRTIIRGVDTDAVYTATPYMVVDGETFYGISQSISAADLMN